MAQRKFFTSDTHFGHANILKYEPNSRRFATIEEHDLYIVKMLKYFVQPGDILYHLGDIGMKASLSYIQDLFRKIDRQMILIRGNHDKYSNASLRRLGFTSILEEAKIKIGKITIKLSHYPYYEDGDPFDTKFKDVMPRREDMWLAHGHNHSKGPKIDRINQTINIGWDHWKGPVIEDTLRDIIQNQGVRNEEP